MLKRSDGSSKIFMSVHCSVNEAPWRTVVKCPRRSRSCMLFSRHDCFSWVLWGRNKMASLA